MAPHVLLVLTYSLIYQLFVLQVAYNKQFEALQAKLKDCVEKQSTSMEGLAKLSEQLGNDAEPQNFDDVERSNDMVDDDEVETKKEPEVKKPSGVNKAPKCKARMGRKYSHMHKAKGATKAKVEKPKKKPKYFCQF